MHFTKLRLVGFKSFVEASDFEIEPGLTGVVGPNGCGKSNLVEALRWVMGESSYKSMRASGMDDVIFSGAGDRPARNVAEVGLTLDNSRRTAPAAFNDVDVLEITRRIERGEGSTYRINGREVRARDVQILFADASTGARSPALVRQGQIAEIIAAKPQARRRILEEAAGVAGLHTRRHEAELRLKGAEDNLGRIDDVIAQIAAQGDGLRRQARHAQRYRELQADIRRAQALAVLIDHEEAAREVEAARATLTAATAAVVEGTRAQGEAARHQAIAAHALPALREAEGEASAALQKVVVARETLDGEERRAKGRFAEIERRIKEMAGDLARESSVVDDAARMLGKLGGEAGELDAASGSATDESGLAARLAEAERAREDAETALAAAQTRLADAEAQRRALAARRADETARLARFEREHAEAQSAQARLRASLDPGDGLEAAAAAARLAAEAVAVTDTEAREAEIALGRAREAEQAGRGPLAEADRASQRLETELRTLAKLLEAGPSAKWPPITDSLRVTKGYEAALGAALGDDLDAASDPRAPAHWAGTDSAGDPPLPEGAVPLVRFVDGASALARRLAQIGLCARADGLVLRAQLQPGQRLVSREGDIWRWDGFTQAAEAPTPAARRLVERNRLAELRLAATEAAATFAGLKATSEATAARLREATNLEARARTAQRDARRTHETSREAHAALERRIAEAGTKLATLDATVASAAAARGEAAERKARAEAALAALPPSDNLAGAVATARAAVATYQATEDRDTSYLAGDRPRSRSAGAPPRRDRRRVGLVGGARQAGGGAPRRCRRAAHGSAGRARHARRGAGPFHSGPARDPRRRRGSEGGAPRGVGPAGQGRDHTGRRRSRRARRARRVRRGTRGPRASRGNATRPPASASTRSCAPPRPNSIACRKPCPRWPASRTASRAQQPPSSRRGSSSSRASASGSARSTCAPTRSWPSLEGQRQGLDKEKGDLAEAIRRLRQAISSLNKEGRERLLGAFDVVNGHFTALFTSLFGGGTAELQLVESDDPLEAGLEIMARPPGKKPQVMTLLSGGEQALTAMSLIFAVFLTNPSPICVLDEVDAPLDDANVERFCDLVDEMRRKTDTRFIAITHNPITMARMDRLFGVTMAERGVSQLVSVDLAEAEVMLEAGVRLGALR